MTTEKHLKDIAVDTGRTLQELLKNAPGVGFIVILASETDVVSATSFTRQRNLEVLRSHLDSVDRRKR